MLQIRKEVLFLADPPNLNFQVKPNNFSQKHNPTFLPSYFSHFTHPASSPYLIFTKRTKSISSSIKTIMVTDLCSRFYADCGTRPYCYTTFANFDSVSHSNRKRSAIILGAELFAQSVTFHLLLQLALGDIAFSVQLCDFLLNISQHTVIMLRPIAVKCRKLLSNLCALHISRLFQNLKLI